MHAAGQGRFGRWRTQWWRQGVHVAPDDVQFGAGDGLRLRDRQAWAASVDAPAGRS